MSETKERGGHDCTLDTATYERDRAACRSCRRIWARGSYGWRRTNEIAPPEPIPAPEISARDVQASELPKGARDVLAHAESRGWTVKTSYARGTLATSRTRRVVDAHVLRIRRYPRAALAIWHDGKFASAVVNDPNRGMRTVNATVLRAWLDKWGRW